MLIKRITSMTGPQGTVQIKITKQEEEIFNEHIIISVFPDSSFEVGIETEVYDWVQRLSSK